VKGVEEKNFPSSFLPLTIIRLTNQLKKRDRVVIKDGSIKVGNGSRVIYDVLEKKVILKVQGLFKIF